VRNDADNRDAQVVQGVRSSGQWQCLAVRLAVLICVGGGSKSGGRDLAFSRLERGSGVRGSAGSWEREVTSS
jgi:hypothetical protein